MIKIVSSEILAQAESIFFNNLKNTIKPYESPRFLEAAKAKFPGKDLHHIFGSYTGSKRTDYLIYPFKRNDHVKAENNKSEYGIEIISEAINILQWYTKGLEEGKF